MALQVDSFTPAHWPFGMPIDVASVPAGSIQRVCRDVPSVACLFSLWRCGARWSPVANEENRSRQWEQRRSRCWSRLRSA